MGYAQNLLQIRGGTEAAGYQPSDVCTLTVQDAQLEYKLELTSIQGRMLVNGWHMKLNLKSAQADFKLSPRISVSRLQMQKTEKDLLFMKLYQNGFAFVCTWLER